MNRLSTDEIERRLSSLDGWVRIGDAIVKRYTFGSFPDAIGFAVRVAFAAEAADHHPEISIAYRKVTLSYSTHSAGGVTGKDFAGAVSADEAARGGTPAE